jgi:hypothetical protein
MYTVKYFAYGGPPLKLFACMRHISCGGPPSKFFASGGPGQPAAAGFQPAASAASAGQAGTLSCCVHLATQLKLFALLETIPLLNINIISNFDK